MKTSCPVCNSNKINFLFINKDRMFKKDGTFHINNCNNCKLIFIAEEIQEDVLRNYYPINYYTKSPEINTSGKILKLISLYSRNSNKNLLFFINRILKSLGKIPLIIPTGQSKYLDYGCGNGELLDRMKILGWNTFAYDFDDDIKKNIEKKHTFINPKKNWSNYFDLITATDVIEHLPNLKDDIYIISEMLAHNGLLILSTPTKSIFFKIFKKYWYPLDTPRHLYIFNKNNLKRLLNEYNLDIVKIEKINFFSYLLDSLQNISNKNHKLLSFLKKTRILFLLNFIIYGILGITKIGETLIIYARKK